MSGTVSVAPGARWSASSWLFDWVVECIADPIDDDGISVRLHTMVENNFGWLDFGDFEATDLDLLTGFIQERLGELAAQRLQVREGYDRQEAVDHIESLVDLVRSRRNP